MEGRTVAPGVAALAKGATATRLQGWGPGRRQAPSPSRPGVNPPLTERPHARVPRCTTSHKNAIPHTPHSRYTQHTSQGGHRTDYVHNNYYTQHTTHNTQGATRSKHKTLLTATLQQVVRARIFEKIIWPVRLVSSARLPSSPLLEVPFRPRLKTTKIILFPTRPHRLEVLGGPA